MYKGERGYYVYTPYLRYIINQTPFGKNLKEKIMRTRRNWARTTIAMLTLIATVLETGFTSVSTLAAEITTEDGIVVNTDEVEDTLTDTSEPEEEVVDIQIESDDEYSEVEETIEEEPEEFTEEEEEAAEDFTSEIADELKAGTFDVSDSGISGSGFEEFSIFVDTDELANRDKFRIEFTGPSGASYNPVLNEDLDRTNDGRYDFDGLEGGDFTIRAKSSDNVILSYTYNEEGYPLIVLKSEETEKVLTTKVLTAQDDSRISAISGSGYDSVTVEFKTSELSNKTGFELIVESDAAATVDGRDAKAGISGLSNDTNSLLIDNLDGESFAAYVVADGDTKIEAVAEVISVEDGRASIEINDVATKRVYEYEDSRIYVRATLEKADAVPDDAYFDVTPLTDEEAEKYLAALNENKDEENGDVLATKDNTLLYDIGFYTDDSKSEEIEPEDGSVTINVEFKKNQLEEELGISTVEDIEVTHFVEGGSQIETESLDVNNSSDVSAVEVVTDSFSVFAFTANNKTGKVQVGEPGSETSKGLLGDAWLYGITADTWRFSGEAETSFALNTLTGTGGSLNGGQTGVNSSKAEGSDYQYDMVGYVDGNTRIKGYPAQIVIPSDQQSKLTHESGSSYIRYINQSAGSIKSQVDGMISYVANKSSELASKDSVTSYSGLPENPWGNHIYLDITDAEDGTYYINLDKYTGLKKAFENNGQVHITKNPGQKIVFNTTDSSSLTFNKYEVIQNGVTYQSTQLADMSTAKNPLVEDIIFNAPNATSVHIQDGAGIFLLPNASVTVGGVGGGWLVANNVTTNCEWHFVNGNLPEPKDNETDYEFTVTKSFDGAWPAEGFTFKIEAYAGDSVNQGVTVDSKVMPSLSEVTIYESTPDKTASFGKVTFTAKDIYNRGNDYSSFYGSRSVHGFCYMYKITEVIPNPTTPGVIYDEGTWYLKLWVNAEKISNNGSDEYQVWVEPKTARSVDDGTICEPGDTQPVVFTNEYAPTEIPVTISGIKQVNGSTDNVPDGKFTFSLYTYTKGDNWNTSALYTVKNTGSSFTFPEMTLSFSGATGCYDANGNLLTDQKQFEAKGKTAIFYYKVVESSDCAPYVYDKTAYIVKVTLTREGNTINTPVIEYYRFADPGTVSCRNYPQVNKTDEAKGITISDTLLFNNTYSATGKTTIYGIKKLENRALKAGEFTFTISSTDDKNLASRKASTSVTNDAFGNFDFGEMSYTLDDVGEYHYTVSETKGTDSSVQYTDVTYDVTVTVKDNGDGTLSVTTDKGTAANRLSFTNVYAAKGSVVFQATKKYETGSALSGRTFSFILKGNGISAQTKSVTGEGTVTFDEINYELSEVGTYNYTIEEDIPAGAVALSGDPSKKIANGVIYDARKYNITVVVSDNGSGVLQKVITAGYDDETKAEVSAVNPEFINGYSVSEITTSIGGSKVLYGKELESGEFTFTLEAGDEATAAAVSAGDVVLPADAVGVQNGATGSLRKDEFKFGDITFKTAGTYKFLVKEAVGDKEDISYSTEEFKVTVDVKDDGAGKLYVASKDKTDTDIIFHNTKNGDGEVKLFAKKILTGRTIEAGQFTFVLKDASGKEIDTKTNDASGAVAFAPIKYKNNANGLSLANVGDTASFTYTISEVVPDEVPAGYIYDNHEETVTVTVTLNADGTLSAVADKATVDSVTFNNAYHATGTVTFDGTKQITGRKFEDSDSEKFKAELYNEAGTLIQTVPITKSTALFGDKGGEFSFDAVSFNETQVGTHKFTIKESGAADNVEMDSTVYTVTVTVTDNGDGTLNVAKEYDGYSSIGFTNKFTANGSTAIVAKKAVSGTTLSGKEFKFELKDASGDVVDTQSNTDGGQIIFNNDGKLDALNYDQDDVENSPFIYTISEKSVDKSGYTLDDTVYYVKVFLSLNADGSIKAEPKYYRSADAEKDIPEASVVFNNTYAATGEVTLAANKTLTGRDLENGQFTFILRDENGNVVDRVGNASAQAGKAGAVTFSTITYTQEDLDPKKSYQIETNKYAKYYTIREDIPADAILQDDGSYILNGYTYDANVYNVVVTLEDKGNGQIDTDWYAYKTGTQPEKPSLWDNIVGFLTGKKADKNAAFVNEYEAEGAIELSAKKILSGKTLSANDFSFTLSGKDEDGKSFSETKDNDASGNVSFDRITYTKPGNYVYTIEEVVPGNATVVDGLYVLNGVKYDPSKYEIAVTVDDPGNGKLSVSASVNGEASVTSAEVTEDGRTVSLCRPDAVKFNNTYDTEPVSVTLGGTKALTGRDMADGEFSFTLQNASDNAKEFKETVGNTGNAFTFTAITFTADDLKDSDGVIADSKTFDYTITEDAGTLTGVTYDSTEYNVRITVSNNKGVLTAAVISNGIETAADKAADFTNTYDADGSLTLTVRKLVNGSSSADKKFEFVLTGDGIDANAPYTATAANGETAAFKQLSYRLSDLNKNADGSYSKTYNYTVSETDLKDNSGYEYSAEVYNVKVDVTSDGKSGVINVDKTITKNGAAINAAAMEFTNTYSATGETVISGTKNLVGGKLNDDDYTFILSAKDENGEYAETARTTNKGGAFSFTLDYTQDDIGKTYLYRVSEFVPDNSETTGIVYDETVYDVSVTVEDNKDGTLKVVKNITKGDDAVEGCSFTNAVVTPDSVVFTAQKNLSGKAIGDDMFTFTLMGDGQDQEVKNVGTTVTFKPIEYTLEDAGKTYTYVIKELQESSTKGITFDKTKYTAEVTVTLENGALKIDRKLKKDGEEYSGAIEFNNSYNSSTTATFGGSKTLSGFVDGATPLGTYTFGLYDANGNIVKVDGKDQLVTIEPKNATDPTEFKFDTITFDQDDYLNSAESGHRFVYTVKEVVPDVKAANVGYDSSEYNITVELYEDVDGLLQARVSTAQGVDVDKLSFTNTYAAEGEIVIKGIKDIEGKSLEDGKYTFTLTGDGVSQEKKNSGNQIVFDKISYTQADIGTHVYEIRETNSEDGSTADTTYYEVEVVVGEGSDGKLTVDKTITRIAADGTRTVLGEDAEFTFVNTYEAAGSITIDGKKIMHNKPLKAEDFWFVLYDEDGKEVQRVANTAASLNNKKDLIATSDFSFELEFDQDALRAADGSYLSEITKYYTVSEEYAEKAGVEYSDAEYVVEVTIKANGTSELEVTKKVRSRSEAVSEAGGLRGFFARLTGNAGDTDAEIVFENSYDAECIIDPPILNKQIMGREIERDMFSFAIDGPGLVSMGEEETGYHRVIRNGINPATGDIYYTDSIRNGEEIDPGEIYVGDIKYRFIDLDIDLDTGEASRTFEYIATEKPEENTGVDYSPKRFSLTVTVTDNGDGTLSTDPALENMKWVSLDKPELTEEEIADPFVNVFNQFGYIDIPGVKKIEGRELTADDKFLFTITDDATGESKTISNTNDVYGKPSVVAFTHDGENAVPFLNYRYGAVEDENGELVEVNETGLHTYTITEEETDKAGIVIDSSGFKVTVDVQPVYDEDGEPILDSSHTGQLSTSVVSVEQIFSENNKEAFDFADGNYFEFKNKFTATGEVSFDGIKYLKDQSGDAITSADKLLDKYGFAIYQYSDAARTLGKTLVDSTKTAADGRFTLSVPEYTQEVLKNEKGEYDTEKTLYYRIIETKPSNGVWVEDNTIFESEGIIYDNTEYDVDVTVKYDGTSNLVIEKAIRNADTQEAVTNITYTNLVREYVTVAGSKFWVDNVKDPATRPDVVVHLYSSGIGNGIPIINTYTIKAPATTYSFTTDKDGNPLPAYDYKGRAIKYSVKEVAIDGYLAEQNGYDLINTMGDIMIRKIDDDTKTALAGATLAILDGSAEIERWVSGSSAHVVDAQLSPGKTYTLREISAPEGYDLADDVTFTAPSNGRDITVTMSDKRIVGSVRLTKRDATTRDTLAGAEFALYTDGGTRVYATGSAGSYSATQSTSNGVFVTDGSGSLTISDLPYGTYYFVETKAPEGYTLSSERLGFTVLRTGELIEVTYLDTKATGSVRLRKVGATGTRTLAGAVFELYAATPRSIGQAASSTIFSDAYFRYGTYRTNAAGELYVGNLPWDDYYFIEVEAPEGYEIAADVNGDPLVYTFTIDASTAEATIDLGGIVNRPEEVTPPSDTTTTTTVTPVTSTTPTPAVLGARVKRGGVVNGVLGVRAKPSSGVLGVRVGPVTGDASNIILWLLLLGACVATIVATVVTGRKKKGEAK